MPTPNPVPRQFRRGHPEDATAEERQHAFAHRSGAKPAAPVDPTCWFCQHRPVEHLDHDVLVPECPDCDRNARTPQYILDAYARQLEYQRAGLLPTPKQHQEPR